MKTGCQLSLVITRLRGRGIDLVIWCPISATVVAFTGARAIKVNGVSIYLWHAGRLGMASTCGAPNCCCLLTFNRY